MTKASSRAHLQAPLGEEIGPSFEEIQDDVRNYDRIRCPDPSGAAERRSDLAGCIYQYLVEEAEVKAHANCESKCSGSVRCYVYEGHDWGGARGVLVLWDHFQPTFWSLLICSGLDETPLTQEILAERWGCNPFEEAETEEEAYDYEGTLRTRQIFVCGEWERKIEGLGKHERRAERFKKWET